MYRERKRTRAHQYQCDVCGLEIWSDSRHVRKVLAGHKKGCRGRGGGQDHYDDWQTTMQDHDYDDAAAADDEEADGVDGAAVESIDGINVGDREGSEDDDPYWNLSSEGGSEPEKKYMQREKVTLVECRKLVLAEGEKPTR